MEMQQNPVFSNLQEKRKSVREIGRFDNSWVQKKNRDSAVDYNLESWVFCFKFYRCVLEKSLETNNNNNI